MRTRCCQSQKGWGLFGAVFAINAGLVAAVARGNAVGGDLQNFNPTTDGLDFVTVQSSEVLDPGIFNLGLFVNHAVNSLPYYEDEADSQNRLRYTDQLTTRDLSVGLGLAPDLEIGVNEQYLLKQSLDDDLPHGEFSGPGPINDRFLAKYRLLNTADYGLAVVGSVVVNRVRNNPFVGRGGSNVSVFELAGDTTLKKIAVAVNLGYRYRKKGDPIPGAATKPMGSQVIGSFGLSYLLPAVDTKLIVEVFGARPAEGGGTGMSSRQASSAEVLAGLKWDVSTNVALHAGAGTELINGASSPDWRAYAGINWAFGPAWHPSPAAHLVKNEATGEEEASLYSINFAFGSDQVPADAVPELTALALEIKAKSYKKITLEGHTDSVGSAANNQSLSERRAQAVAEWLVANGGIDKKRVVSVGYGETRPIADNGNFQGRTRNRRVAVRVER